MDHERFCANKIRENLRKVAQDIKAEKVIKRVEGDMQEFEKFRFTGTPVIVINGVALHGAQPSDEIERIIALTTKE